MKSIKLEPKLYEYFLNQGVRESPVLQEIRAYAEQHARFKMLSTPDAGQLLAMMVRLTKAKHILEIGTFLGYSAAAMAEALPKGVKNVTCELEQEYADIAQSFWQQANMTDKIDCMLGPALETLTYFSANQFDLIFIDADKPHYPDYYKASLNVLKPGGLIILDNMLFHGRVVDENEHSSGTKAIRELNTTIKQDHNIDMMMLTVGDGMTLVFKR